MGITRFQVMHKATPYHISSGDTINLDFDLQINANSILNDSLSIEYKIVGSDITFSNGSTDLQHQFNIKTKPNQMVSDSISLISSTNNNTSATVFIKGILVSDGTSDNDDIIVNITSPFTSNAFTNAVKKAVAAEIKKMNKKNI